MSKVTTTEKTKFVELMGSADAWASVDQLVAACNEAEIWPEGFLETVEAKAKKAHVRRMVRSLKDEGGWPLWASIETTNERGEPVRIYKQETLFDVGDYRQVVHYHSDRSRHHRTMAIGYAQRCKRRFGRQLMLPFDDEIDHDRPAEELAAVAEPAAAACEPGQTIGRKKPK